MQSIVKNHSLTMRFALLFAALSFVVLGLVGIMLYRGLVTQLTVRDDAALITRVDQIRTLLQDSNTLKLINEKPKLFENMLANREALLVIRFAGQSPLIEVNPGKMPIPNIKPLDKNATLSLDAVHRSMDAEGVPFIALAASTRPADADHDLEIIAGRAMTERTRLLEGYRNRILVQISIAALLFALVGYWLVRRGLLPLRRLAAQTETITVTNLAARIDGTGAPRELAPVIDSFNAMLARLATGFTQLSQVSADMAHDLRTPINNLLGQTEVALSQPRSADHYELLLASNLEELQRLSKMTDNMLFLARSENADTAIDRKTLDVQDELQRMADYFEGLAEDRHLRIETKGDGSVYADPMLLRRALANLVANAIQYADEDTTILLRSEQTTDGTTLSVENHGPTIAEHHLRRVFDRFYRADASRRGSADSSGLGLSIVRTIMTLHQGVGSATSEKGVTRFNLFFPAA
jgi:two-component system, OmpR family, heavy metal sensor histidine kinase CusS